MKKMLIWETSPSISGGQRMTLTVMELLQNEYEFLCLIPSEGVLSEELKRRGINYLCIGDQTLPVGVKGWQAYLRYAHMSLRSILRSMGAIRRFRPDVLYAPGPAALPWSAICGALCGKPVVWHLHHLFTDGPTKKLLSFTSRWKAVRKIIAVSRVVGEQITSSAGRAKVQPLYNPVDAARFSSGNADCILAETEAALGHAIPEEEGCVLMQIAVLRPTKRQEQFLRVVAALKRQGVPVTGILVGGAITEDDRRFEASLRQLIAEEGLTTDVYMAGQRSNIPDYLAAASVVLIPSQEGLPLAALEAMSAGKPIVAIDTGGVAELVREAGCGTLYPLDAPPEKIAEIIRDAWQNDQQEGVRRGIGFCQTHGLAYYREAIGRIFAAVCNNCAEGAKRLKRKCIIITNPMIAANKSAQVTLGKFVRVMSACYEEIVVLGGNVSLEDAPENVSIRSVEIRRAGSRIRRMLDLFACQVQVAHVLRRCAEQDVPVYFWVADKMLLPFRVARWEKADTRYFLYGNVLKEGKASWLRSLSARLIIYMARRASSVCVESPGVLREWEGYVALGKARVIHLYSDPQPFTPISRRQKIIGMLCRLTEGKHVLESIEAFAQFHGQHSGYTLEIVGSGKQEAACRALIARLGAQAYIHMTGWLEHRQIAEHTAAWQYLLFPSDTEGMPNSVIEMMAQGIPAIASPVGGVRDIVRHGENGWLLDGVTASDIHAALCCAAAQDACYPAMAQAARETVEAPYSLHGARENARKNI